MTPHCTLPPPIPPKRPRNLHPQLSLAWDYLVQRGGCCYAYEFDADHAPIGPSLREQLGTHGVVTSVSGMNAIIFFP